ncbi:MAG TPA: hypothetical protein PKD96_01035, partial [Candidatus Absconditabacterales bacterium]|nr:hypothetical protein [Candidatus Absconditabacterales bacterium]HMT26864.1 hypothetical protein [Candidatus Absconditabacterales bacterium]
MSFLKYFFSIFFLAVLTGGVSLGAMGDPWSFPGLTIIGRDQRGANPAWLYDDYASYQPIRDGWKKSAD